MSNLNSKGFIRNKGKSGLLFFLHNSVLISLLNNRIHKEH